MTRLLVAIGAAVLLLSAVPAAAQDAIPTEYTLTTHLESNANGAPISTFTFQKAAAVCDQAPTPANPGVVANPRYIRWTDPERPTRECVYDTGVGGGPLFAMPFGGRYIGKLAARAVIGGVNFDSSQPSDPSNPFVRGASPAVVGGVRIGSSAF